MTYQITLLDKISKEETTFESRFLPKVIYYNNIFVYDCVSLAEEKALETIRFFYPLQTFVIKDIKVIR